MVHAKHVHIYMHLCIDMLCVAKNHQQAVKFGTDRDAPCVPSERFASAAAGRCGVCHDGLIRQIRFADISFAFFKHADDDCDIVTCSGASLLPWLEQGTVASMMHTHMHMSRMLIKPSLPTITAYASELGHCTRPAIYTRTQAL